MAANLLPRDVAHDVIARSDELEAWHGIEMRKVQKAEQ
jgi:hypothetical protein